MSAHNLNTVLHPNLRNFINVPGFSVTGVNDCFLCPDALHRFEDRCVGIFGSRPSCRAVRDDMTAACALIATLDAKRGAPTVVCINAAPRGTNEPGVIKQNHDNGTPFGFVKYGETLITSTLTGYELSLAKKLLPKQVLGLLEVPAVMEYMLQLGRVTETQAQHVCNSQYRSFEFLPDAAAWLYAGENLPFTEISMDQIPDMPGIVWKIDNFGNCCTTIQTCERVGAVRGGRSQTLHWGVLPHYERLADVPRGKAAIVSGSSGFGFGHERRFLEIVVGGMGNAAKELGITVGSEVFEVFGVPGNRQRSKAS